MGEGVFEGLVTPKGPESAQPTGVVDRLEDYARPGQDLARVPPEVRVFFEDCVSLELEVRPSWTFWVIPFAWAWHLFAWAMGQLCLPVRPSRILTRALPLDPRVSPHARPRGVIRHYAGRAKVMQAMVYAVRERDERGYMSATFPLPGLALEGILRLETSAPDSEGRVGVKLTSAPEDATDREETGVFLHTPLGRIRTPFAETLELWSSRSSSVPTDLGALVATNPKALLVGRHEQRLFGVLLVRHRYAFSGRGSLGPGSWSSSEKVK